MTPIELVLAIFTLLIWAIIARALLSWVRPNPENPAVKALHVVTEPLLLPFRLLVPPRVLGGLDVSPIVAILVLQFLASLLRGA